MKTKETKKTKKKIVTTEVKVKAKPKSVVSKVAAIKPKPAVKAPKKKAVAAKIKAKVEVKAKPKSVVGKVAAKKPKPAVKAEKKAPKKKAVAAKTKAKIEVKAKPKSVVGKVAAKKPRPAVKAEEKAVREEPKPKAEQYPAINSRARLKIFLPDQDLTKEEAEKIFFGGLPEEYGENSVIALVVDPNTVFVDWEVIPKDISDSEGDLNLRFYDITGIEFNDWNANAILNVPINKRVGSGFFDIHMPGRDVVVAVGILNAVSGFMPIVRSDMVSFPELLTFDELGIVQKLFESGVPVGY